MVLLVALGEHGKRNGSCPLPATLSQDRHSSFVSTSSFKFRERSAYSTRSAPPSQRYWRKARQLRLDAERASNPTFRRQLLDIADQYDELAADLGIWLRVGRKRGTV